MSQWRLLSLNLFKTHNANYKFLFNLALYQQQSQKNVAQWTALISSTTAATTLTTTLTTTATSTVMSTVTTAAPIVMSHCNGRLGNQVNFTEDFNTLMLSKSKEYRTAKLCRDHP